MTALQVGGGGVNQENHPLLLTYFVLLGLALPRAWRHAKRAHSDRPTPTRDTHATTRRRRDAGRRRRTHTRTGTLTGPGPARLTCSTLAGSRRSRATRGPSYMLHAHILHRAEVLSLRRAPPRRRDCTARRRLGSTWPMRHATTPVTPHRALITGRSRPPPSPVTPRATPSPSPIATDIAEQRLSAPRRP